MSTQRGGRPRWTPDDKTLKWIAARVESLGRKERRFAREDGTRGRWHSAIEHDARALALEELLASLHLVTAESENENESEPEQEAAP